MAMPSASLSPAADHRPSSLLPFCRSYPLSAVGEDAQQQQHTMSGGWVAAARPAPFTAAQYEELEQQALIYKYLVAGVPVPLDLLLPIRRGFVYHQTALGYGPYFGKKVDPEPGRCRRTDGKKWRCSKEAAPDSKYCERHMHRGRNRSRKPVEAQLVAPPHSLQPPALANPAAGFQNNSLYPAIASNCGGRGGGGGGGGGPATGTFSLGSTAQLHLNNPVPYATAAGGGSKDLRPSAFGIRYNHFSGDMDTPIDNSWRQLPSQTSTFQVSSYPLYGTLGGLDENTICSLPKTERELLSFFGNDFVTVNSAKQENQTLRPFFDEWPKSRDSWPDLADDSSLSSFSATQLSISIPMATSDFNTNSRSSNGTQSR